MADAESRMNVTALKRVDPYVKEIIDTATHVALYQFNREDNKWEKTEIEGALFIYSRNGQPQNSIIIMNRLNTNNLVEPVVQKLDLQLQSPFLLYRNSRFKIYGIWFYDKDECVRIATLLEKLIEQVPPQIPATAPVPDTMAGIGSNPQQSIGQPHQYQGGVDIFGMLSKAQENFKNSSTVPKPVPPDVTSQSVMDFFAKATTGGGGGGAKTESFMQQIFNNPVHSVEHIEKQVRASTPKAVDNNPKDEMQIQLGTLSLVESGLARLQTSPEQQKAPNVLSALTSPMVRQNTAPPALMPPTMFTTTPMRPSGGNIPINNAITPTTANLIDLKPEPLTRNQFIQAFTHMLRNDPDFVTKLHEAYVKSFSELVS